MAREPPRHEHRRQRPSERPEYTPRSGEVRVSGIEPVRALFAHRPNDVRRVYVIAEAARELADVLAGCRAPQRTVSIDELCRIADSVKHDGVCVIAKKKPTLSLERLLAAVDESTGPLALVLLDGVKNPNNVGAIARVCSHFGARYLITTGDTAGFSMAAMRTAQGAAETVEIVALTDGRSAVRELRARGFSVIAASSHARRRLGEGALPPRALFLLGAENAGVSGALLDQADLELAIPGAGDQESLNVACATTVMLWEHWRAFRAGDAAPAPPSTAAPRRTDRAPSQPSRPHSGPQARRGPTWPKRPR